MTIKLIATDMDGTFLNDHGDYDQERFANDYAALQRRGIQFVIASGHQAAELATTFSAYPEMWLIGGNGAELWQREAGLSCDVQSPSDSASVSGPGTVS